MIEFILILISWFIQMPLWLSILTTCVAGISAIWKIIKLHIKIAIEKDLD